jgi:hypothetical protein
MLSVIIMKYEVSLNTFGICFTHLAPWKILPIFFILNLKGHLYGAASRIVINLLVSFYFFFDVSHLFRDAFPVNVSLLWNVYRVI